MRSNPSTSSAGADESVTRPCRAHRLMPSFSSASHDRDEEAGEHRFDHGAARQRDRVRRAAKNEVMRKPGSPGRRQ